MAIASSGQISMGGAAGTDRSILNEKQNGTTARTNVSLKGLSVDGIADSSGGDIAGTPDGNAPYGMAEFHGFSSFAWGSNINPTTNLNLIYNQFQEDRTGDDTCVVTSCNMTINTSTRIISYVFKGTTDGGGRSGNAFTTNIGVLYYTGTLASLEARFVHTGQALSCTGSANSANGTVRELFSNTSFLSNGNIDENTIDGTPDDSSTAVSTHNDISGGPSGTYRALRTTSGSMAAALAATSDDAPDSTSSSDGIIAFSGSDSLKLELRANGSVLVNLYTRTGTFDMRSLTSLDGDS